ncbi:glycosyltransferase [Acuticoccus mangrovi]|uniref:Glycosyltransferase n=1 Tax=Acuticoccus mangrovi TaxID=2796142 RepID=A0A934IRJ7_9HYPH|nr:glycosyltransferase [Acuticoccus mangrovi]MBJ3777426.1 glycosyltransferase [Acuticoccus mangrovi]
MFFNKRRAKAEAAGAPEERSVPEQAAVQSVSAALAAPEGAPFRVVAAWHDRLLIAAPPGLRLGLDERPFLPVGTRLADVDLLSDPAGEDVATHWRTYLDGGHAVLGRDVAPDWQLADGHTLFMRVNVAARASLKPVDIAYRDPELGEALPVASRKVRWRGLFAAHRGVLEVRVEFYDASDRYVGAAPTPVPEAFGGRHPDGYSHLAATVDVPPGAVALRFKITLTPLAGAEEAYAFFAGLKLAEGDGVRPVARRLTPLGPLLQGLGNGDLLLMEAPLPQPSRGAPPMPLVVRAGRERYPIGERRALDGVGRIAMEGRIVTADAGRWAGEAVVLADGRAVAEMVSAPSAEATGCVVEDLTALFDGRSHRLELVSEAGRLAVGFASAPAHATPWTRIAEEVVPPLPGFGSPLAEHRYRALLAHARAAAKAPLDPWLVAHLPALHDALVAGPQQVEPFPLRFPQHETPAVSVVIPVHDGYGLTFIALAALLFAPVEATFEVIVADDGSADGTAGALAAHEGLRVVRHDHSTGFLRAANAGAAKARGRHILFLNNDTEVTAGWLDALLAAMDAFPGTGIVGPKVIYPDGALQDAGGSIDHNGDPTMVGRGGNPFDPRYSYGREVDYVSGAALLVDAALWRAVGGFSEIYAPAYFEDVDLCFKAREAGRRVRYAPGAVVVHSEGGSHGVDESAGIKRHQALNAPVFKRTWAHRRPPELPAWAAHDRNVTARVLFVLIELPRTDVDAGSVAAEEEIRLIQALGAKVTLLPRSMEYLPRYAEAMQAMGVEVIHAPFATSMEAFLEARGREFDAVYVTRFQVAEALLPAIERYAPDAKILLNLADLQFLRELRGATQSGDAAALEAARATRARELAAMRCADAVLSYSDVEASVVFSHTGPEVAVVKAPWVQRVQPLPAPFAGRAGLAFLGNYHHPPNVEAVRWFAAEVAPRLAERRPDVAFTAYGAYAQEALAGIDGIVVGGHVADLQAMFDRHRLFVAPLRSGAGVKGKVFQAMAAGIPSVLSAVAAEGIAITPGREALVADEPADIVAAILSIYDDPARWQAVADAARRLIETRYGVEQGVAEMRAAFEAAGLFLPDRTEGPSGAAEPAP